MATVIDTRIAGIPCKVRLEYHPPLSGSFDQPEEGEHFTIEEVMDSRGRRAAWLDAKMTPEDEQRICEQAIDGLRGDRAEIAYETREERHHVG